MTAFPRPQLAKLQELAARLLDSRRPGSDDTSLARDLLAGFHDACTRAGLDGALAGLAARFPPLDITDRFALADHPQLLPALAAKLTADFDSNDGGPRNARPRLLADCLVAVLGLELVDPVDGTVHFDDAVRTEVAAALASVLDVELAAPHLRETTIAMARARCEPQHLTAFNRLVKELDDVAMRLVRQPKLPLDAVQAIQHVLGEVRQAILDRACRAAIDRAQAVIARIDADAAARIDRPVTHALTPREVAIRRAGEARVPRTPGAVGLTLLEGLGEVAQLAWKAVEKPVRTYAASQSFAVGDLLEHPKFGRGTVVTAVAQRIEVEFADGKHTLVHVRVIK